MIRDLVVEVENKELSLSNLDKVLYPAAGYTKGQVIHYYTRIAPVLLPHLEGHPLTLKRYPNGVDQGFFYEKRCPPHRPRWVQTVAERPRVTEHPQYCVAYDLATLVWVANLASIELHTLLARSPDLTVPTMVALDLDPGEPAGIFDCVWAARQIRRMLAAQKLESFPKTSGGKGIHLYVPLNTPATYDRTKEFARGIAQALERKFPARATSNMKKEKRAGKVFVDWSQNVEHKTTVCVYSLRARELPTVSAPVTWQELEEAQRLNDESRLVFHPEEVLERVRLMGDLFAPVLTLKQRLPG